MQPYLSLLYRSTSNGGYEINKLAEAQSAQYSSVLKFEPIPDAISDVLPSMCFPVHPRLECNTLRIYHAQHYCPWHTSSPQPALQGLDFEYYISKLPSWKQQILLHWETVAKDQLLLSLQYAVLEFSLASDGGFSLENGTGTFGAIVADDISTIAPISGSAPGRQYIHCSFRSEQYGLLAVCSLLNKLFSDYDIRGTYTLNGRQSSRRITVWLDIKSVISRVTKHRHYEPQLGDMLDADMDLELQTLLEIKAATIENRGFDVRPLLQYVKAHQDGNKDYCTLSKEAQMNVDADRLATEFATSNYSDQYYCPPSAVKASLYIDVVAITAKYKECIRHAVHQPALKQYMQTKWTWEDTTVEDIWWMAHGSIHIHQRWLGN